MNQPSNSQSLFALKLTKDEMIAFIPANTPISKTVINLTYAQICEYLKNQGIHFKPKPKVIETLKATAASKLPKFKEHFLLVKGRVLTPAKRASIKWLNPPNIPKDLVRPDISFAIVTQPTPTKPACTVLGKELPFPYNFQEEAPFPPMTFHSEFVVEKNGEIKCSKGGMVIHNEKSEGDSLEFLPNYVVTDTRADFFQKVDFPCDVEVRCELSGQLEWIIQGNLTANEYWSAPKIVVNGNAIAKSGIQTNTANEEDKAITVQGALIANFIQSSRFIVNGDIIVEKAIIGSNIVCGGKLECLGNPGKIVASEIVMLKGSIFAKMIGSESDKPANLRFQTDEGATLSKIDSLSEGTRMQIQRAKLIMKDTLPWPIPKK